MDHRPPTLLHDWEELRVDLRLLRLWLLALVSRDRQDVDCPLVSLALLPVLEDLALASVHRRSLVAHLDSEDHHLALVDVEDPQADPVSCSNHLSLAIANMP